MITPIAPARAPLRALATLAIAAALAACGGGGDKDAPAPPAAATQVAENTAAPAAKPDPGLPAMTVFKSPTCGCCKAWIGHVTQAGFAVEAHDTAALQEVKDAAGVPQNLRSCHTAHVGAYVIEGHVPADDIKRLLREHPAGVAGLSVPGMVTGSPGMEGGTPEHYDVIAFTRDGKTSIYAHH